MVLIFLESCYIELLGEYFLIVGKPFFWENFLIEKLLLGEKHNPYLGGTSYYRLSSGVRALALALVPSTITDYLALALAQA